MKAAGFTLMVMVIGLVVTLSVRCAAGNEVKFVEITKEAGITFRHYNGAFGKKYMPETMGSGVCFLDYDNDDRQDILLINSMSWPEHKAPRKTTGALYRNLGGRRFADVTQSSGLAIEMYGMGCAVGDYDNDGYVDIYITALGSNYLFRNNGNGTFTDVTAKAGVGSDAVWGTAVAWFDYDRDGYLDLFVGNYVKWSPEKDLWCTVDGATKSYCTPESYEGATNRLYRNNGDGTFTDVTEKAGVLNPSGKTLGVTVFDLNGDGWPDIAVANDTQPNYLYQNNHDGTFTEVGTITGMAVSEEGKARAGMGIDAGDYENKGFFALTIGNFPNEMIGFYRNEGGRLFVDVAPTTAIGKESLLSLVFGLFFFDYDLDGWLDFLAVTGHVDEHFPLIQKDVTYAQRPLLFRNLGKGAFIEVGKKIGGPLARAVVGRGGAYADIDNDGDLDVLTTVNNDQPRLLLNEGGNTNNWVRFKTVGTKSNRDGIGTKIVLRTKEATQTRIVKSGSSYLSQSELPVTFGLGKQDVVEIVEVAWPSGLQETWRNVKANQTFILREGEALK